MSTLPLPPDPLAADRYNNHYQYQCSYFQTSTSTLLLRSSGPLFLLLLLALLSLLLQLLVRVVLLLALLLVSRRTAFATAVTCSQLVPLLVVLAVPLLVVLVVLVTKCKQLQYTAVVALYMMVHSLLAFSSACAMSVLT
jgi:hypothetical protein